MNVQAGVYTRIGSTAHCQAYCKSLQQQRVYVVEPLDAPPRAIILFSHGLCEHAFRHFPLAVELARQGYQTILFDLQGHGPDPEPIEPFLRLAKGYLEETDPQKLANRIVEEKIDTQLVERIHKADLKRLKKVRMKDHLNRIDSIIRGLMASDSDADNPPFFMAGHSLGGLLAAETGWRLGKNGIIRPKGVILLSPGLRPIPPPSSGWLMSATFALSWRSYGNPFLTPVRWLLHGAMSLNFMQNICWVNKKISDIEDERKLHKVDPLILTKVPSGYATSIERQMAKTQRKGSDYPIDAIMIIPGDDHIVNPKGSIAFGKALCAKRGSEDSRLIIYDDFWCHELTHSSKKQETLEALLTWLEAHCK